METNPRETRSRDTVMTRRRTLGLVGGGLVALSVRYGTAGTRPHAPPPEVVPLGTETPIAVSPTPTGEQPPPTKKRKRRKPRHKRR
jgi:hypothetical protein